jgi:uncharacterized membrane protein YdbT with pleckstrin-like domain
MDWLMLPPFFLLLWTAWRHILLRYTKLSIGGNKLRYETGILSRATRTMEISKVQDVHVHQSLFQRIVGIGDLSIETAGESSRLAMKNVDRPQYIADYILEQAHK